MYRDRRKVSGGPPGGSTCHGGLNGLNKGGNQLPSGLVRPPKGPRRLGLETLGEGGTSTLLGGQASPPGRRPPSRWDLEGPAPSPLPPIYSEGVGGQPHPSPGATLPLSNSFSSSVVLSEALPENHELHRHHAIVLLEFSLNFSSPLAGSRRRRRPRVVRVLNAEAPSVRGLIRSSAI